MEAVTAHSRWAGPRSAASRVFTDEEVGRLALEITVATMAMAAIALAVVAVHPGDAVPGAHVPEVALLLALGVPVLAAARRRPAWFARHLEAIAIVSSLGLTVDAAFAGPTFAPFLTMSYLWIGLLGWVFLPTARAARAVGVIGVLYAGLLVLQGDNPAPVVQWCLTVAAVAVTGTLGGALVTSLEERAVAEHELRAEVEASRHALEAANRRKSTFLGAMSHELRTPLNAIIGFADMLGSGGRGPLNAKQAEYVEDICASGAHLSGLIGEVLDVEQVEAGREPLHLSDVDVRALLARCVAMLRQQTARNGVRVELLVDPSVTSVAADERKVRQIVLNLLANAAAFTPARGRIQVQALATGGGVRIGVLDTGPGIAHDDQERVFEDFGQARAEENRRRGTGLGLPLSRRLARQHGGDLWVESEPGSGSAFWLQLPSSGRRSTSRPARLPRPALAPRSMEASPPGRAELVGSAALFLLLPVALVSLPRPLPEGMHPLALSACVGVAIAWRLVIQLLPRATQATRSMLFSTMGVVTVTVAASTVGPRLAPFVTMFYVWIGTNAIAYLSSRAALAQLALAGVCYALLVSLQEGHSQPVVRWELTMGTVILAGLIVRRMVDRLWWVAEDERLAREEVQGANAELSLALRHKTEFLANMSHELRTPLNVIIGFADVLDSEAFGELNPAQRGDVEDILDASHALLGLVDDVLALGKLEAGRMQRHVEPVVLAEVLGPPLTAATKLAHQRDVRLQVLVSAPDAVVELDDAAIARAAGSLVTAAVLATPPGGTCDVRAGLTTDGFVLEVVDGGPSLTDEQRRLVLEELVGVSTAHDTAQALRLALAARYASLHGGGLGVVAAAAGGNRWTLAVPADHLALAAP